MKRVIKIGNVYGTDTKYVLQREYEGFGIYQRKTPNGFLVHQDWLISNNDDVTLVIEPYNNICEEEVLDIIDNYNETGKLGVKTVMHCDSLHMHPSGELR